MPSSTSVVSSPDAAVLEASSGGMDPKLNRESVIDLVDMYGDAWMAQDPEAICALFSDDATYNERPFAADRAIFAGRAAIMEYWKRQIGGKQKNIRFRQFKEDLLLDAENSRCLAKWEAKFDNPTNNGNYRTVHIVQVAILKLVQPRFLPHPLITSLEEYWHSESMDKIEKGCPWVSGSAIDANDRLCWDYARGACRLGADCKYEHVEGIASTGVKRKATEWRSAQTLAPTLQFSQESPHFCLGASGAQAPPAWLSANGCGSLATNGFSSGSIAAGVSPANDNLPFEPPRKRQRDDIEDCD